MLPSLPSILATAVLLLSSVACVASVPLPGPSIVPIESSVYPKDGSLRALVLGRRNVLGLETEIARRAIHKVVLETRSKKPPQKKGRPGKAVVKPRPAEAVPGKSVGKPLVPPVSPKRARNRGKGGTNHKEAPKKSEINDWLDNAQLSITAASWQDNSELQVHGAGTARSPHCHIFTVKRVKPMVKFQTKVVCPNVAKEYGLSKWMTIELEEGQEYPSSDQMISKLKEAVSGSLLHN